MLGWFRASPKQKDGKGEEGKRHKVHLGEAKNKFYYDEKLKRWRVEGEEEGGDGEEDGLSSPPKLGDAGSAALGSLNYSDTGGNGFHAGGDPGAPKAFPETRGPPPRSQNNPQRRGIRSRYVDAFQSSATSSAQTDAAAKTSTSSIFPVIPGRDAGAPSVFVPGRTEAASFELPGADAAPSGEYATYQFTDPWAPPPAPEAAENDAFLSESIGENHQTAAAEPVQNPQPGEFYDYNQGVSGGSLGSHYGDHGAHGYQQEEVSSPVAEPPAPERLDDLPPEPQPDAPTNQFAEAMAGFASPKQETVPVWGQETEEDLTSAPVIPTTTTIMVAEERAEVVKEENGIARQPSLDIFLTAAPQPRSVSPESVTDKAEGAPPPLPPPPPPQSREGEGEGEQRADAHHSTMAAADLLVETAAVTAVAPGADLGALAQDPAIVKGVMKALVFENEVLRDKMQRAEAEDAKLREEAVELKLELHSTQSDLNDLLVCLGQETSKIEYLVQAIDRLGGDGAETLSLAEADVMASAGEGTGAGAVEDNGGGGEEEEEEEASDLPQLPYKLDPPVLEPTIPVAGLEPSVVGEGLDVTLDPYHSSVMEEASDQSQDGELKADAPTSRGGSVDALGMAGPGDHGVMAPPPFGNHEDAVGAPWSDYDSLACEGTEADDYPTQLRQAEEMLQLEGPPPQDQDLLVEEPWTDYEAKFPAGSQEQGEAEKEAESHQVEAAAWPNYDWGQTSFDDFRGEGEEEEEMPTLREFA